MIEIRSILSRNFGGKLYTWFDCIHGEFSCSVTANNIVINTSAVSGL